jgi:hypothetical protein
MRHKIKIATAADLLHIFWPDFVEVDGSIFLPWEAPTQTSNPELGLDRTGMEAFLNHTHMIDLFRHETGRESENEDSFFYDHDHLISNS